MNNYCPARALAWSECALDAMDSDSPCLAVWQPEGTTVAIGLSQQPEIELDIAAMARDGIGLVRRQSGGGAVLLYPGVLCWEAWSNFDHIALGEIDNGIRATYRFLSRPVRDALAEFGLDAVHAGICDISFPGTDGILRKIAGTAQLRRKRNALVHGSLLVSPDMSLLPRYLKFPSSQPDYRNGRSHRDFCQSLAEAMEARGAQADSLIGTVAQKIRQAARRNGWHVGGIPAEPSQRELVLEQEKYRNPDWNWRKKRPNP